VFVKTQTVKADTGKAYTYYRLAKSYRERGKVRQEIVADLGALTAQEAAKLARGFARSGVKQYFSYEAEKGKVRWKENREAVEERKANAGKYALLAKSRLPAEEVLSAYRTLIVAEDVFLVLKDIVDMRPVWHKCDENVEGHILLAVWSYLLYRTLEAYLERAGMDLTAYRALNGVKEVRAVEVALRERAIWKLMRVPPVAKKVFDAVGLRNFKGRFEQWAVDAPPYHYRPCSIVNTSEIPEVSEALEMEL